METQCKKILKYMKVHGSITPLEALSSCGCMRLAARISDLKKAGFDIKTVLVTDSGNRYAKYVLAGRVCS